MLKSENSFNIRKQQNYNTEYLHYVYNFTLMNKTIHNFCILTWVIRNIDLKRIIILVSEL